MLLIILPFLYDIKFVYQLVYELAILGYILFSLAKRMRALGTGYLLEDSFLRISSKQNQEQIPFSEIESIVHAKIESVHLKYGMKVSQEHYIQLKDGRKVRVYEEIINQDGRTLVEVLEGERSIHKETEIETRRLGCLIEIIIVILVLIYIFVTQV
jgi:hypothetical protein